MNLATLKASLLRNKTGLAVAGAAIVAALALRARAKSSTSASSSSTGTIANPSGASPTPSYYTAGNAGATGFDSSASDVYNALQPQIEQVNASIADLKNTIPVPSTVTTTPAAPAPATDARQAAIAQDYQTFLGRTPAPFEVNYWDANGGTLDQIRQGIVASPEAQHRQ